MMTAAITGNNGIHEGDRGTHHKTNGYTSEGDVSDTIPDEDMFRLLFNKKDPKCRQQRQ